MIAPLLLDKFNLKAAQPIQILWGKKSVETFTLADKDGKVGLEIYER